MGGVQKSDATRGFTHRTRWFDGYEGLPEKFARRNHSEISQSM